MSREGFPAARGAIVVAALEEAIHARAAELSELDGAIGDGDHGVNMRKGFSGARDRLGDRSVTVTEALATIGETLFEMGGAMGPLYGTFFTALALPCVGADVIDAERFEAMLDAGVEQVLDLGGATVGDKTLVDVLVPARDAFRSSRSDGHDLGSALNAMASAAEEGRESTRDLVARIGRSSRLGDRSRGHVDAGASSCALILVTLADVLQPGASTPPGNDGLSRYPGT